MAARKRTNFTEAQKAEIYARDRATCAFSGISLWIPDRGLRPEWEMDWVDHLEPSARGGTSTLENGACVSSTFNAKKRDNGSDNLCFFLGGHITRAYVAAFGLPSEEVIRDLRRRAAIVPADWWFNRALCSSLIALDWRVREALGAVRHVRDDEYWIRAALRRHARWTRDRACGSFASRGLLPASVPFGTELMLELESVATDVQYREWLASLWPSYLATSTVLDAFDAASDSAERRDVVADAATDDDVNPQVVAALFILVEEYRAVA